MGLWNKFFGKPTSKGPEKSPYLPKNDDPLDIRFAENFTANGGFFFVQRFSRTSTIQL